ncbi:MAG: hypothetical protein EAZ89_11895 [Bacteroidetes bacterium]|nr:MAG: hypothetical protein EAZ89_11895 [Bacteroidota bacterium]
MNPKAIIERVLAYLNHFRSRWILVLIILLVMTALFTTQGLLRPKYYSAETIFHPEIGMEEGARPEALSLILGDAAGGAGGEAVFMMGILQSRHLSEAVAADSIMMYGQKRLIADLLIEHTPPFTSLTSLIVNTFVPPKIPSTYARRIVSAGRQLRGSLMIEEREDGFIQMQISYYNDSLCGKISRSYIKQLDVYYKRQKTEKAARNVAFFANRADSVKKELDKVSYAIANYRDRNQFSSLLRNEVYPTDLTLKQGMLQQMYSSLIISREQAVAQLQQDTPIIQVLDEPDPPYDTVKASLVLYILIGLFLGLFISFFVVCRKMLVADITQLIQQQLLKAENAATES